MKISSKVYQNVAIAFIVLSFCLIALKFSNYLEAYPSLNSELKPAGISLALLSMGFSAVAKRRKANESKNDQ
jgi:hypothetical protein